MLFDDYVEALKIDDQRFAVLSELVYAGIMTSKPKPKLEVTKLFPRLHQTPEERVANAPTEEQMAVRLAALAKAFGAKGIDEFQKSTGIKA